MRVRDFVVIVIVMYVYEVQALRPGRELENRDLLELSCYVGFDF